MTVPYGWICAGAVPVFFKYLSCNNGGVRVLSVVLVPFSVVSLPYKREAGGEGFLSEGIAHVFLIG